MMKDNKGITLVVLTITVIILFILVGTGMTIIYSGVAETKDNKYYTEIGIVRQAILEQYTLAEAVGQIKVSKETSPVSFWKGTKIEEVDQIELPTIKEDDQNAHIFLERLKKYQPEYQEDFFYRLQPKDLATLGISDAKDEYIVNYSTGEVYNETKKLRSDAYLLYLPSTIYVPKEETEDKETFSDWN